MIRTKTLNFALATAFLGAATSANAQVRLELATYKDYRQYSGGNVNFRGGTYNIHLSDGDVAIGPCISDTYIAPGAPAPCGNGTSGYLSAGTLGGATLATPYIEVTGVVPAVIIEPRQPSYVKLTAAPPSKLPRPSGGFLDESLALYYNLHTTSIREYVITDYNLDRNYTKNDRAKFEAEIVPGVYHYSFPRLNNPSQPAPISAIIYPMVEGIATKNNQTDGFQFTNWNDIGGNKFSSDGFAVLSYRRPNTIKWRKLNAAYTFPTVDTLYFSMREIQDRTNNTTDVKRAAANAIFPGFDNGGDTRVLLTSPFVASFTVPPIFPCSTKGVIEVEVQRTFPTGGVTYDYSRRRFQMPFVVIDFYTDYVKQFFPGKNPAILTDSDGDGYNNLTEWILDSNGAEKSDIPEAPIPVAVADGEDPHDPFAYFGFNVEKKTATTPAVKYTLERSTDGGNTWAPFTSNADWDVYTVNYFEKGAYHSDIRVRSTYIVNGAYAQPPGTAGDKYRVKITLA